MLSILFVLIPILPSSYSLPQGPPSKPLQGVNNYCVTAPSPSEHRDTGGNPPNVGAKCVFPFRYKGRTYHECAFGNVTSSLPENFRWCSTRIHINRTHVRGQGEWGFCSSECFLLDGSFPPYRIDEQIVPPHLTIFAVDTTIQFRYARTRVHLEAVNPSKVSQEFPFSLTLPETAFVMNMSLIYDGAEHVARVEEKKLADILFAEAVEKGETAAQVKKTERDSKKLSVDVNIEPRETVSLVVTYEELLDRKVGRYEYSANINPGRVVDNYTINIQIDESLPIKDLFSFYDSENINTKNINAVEEGVFGNQLRAVAQTEFLRDMTATLTFNPSRQEQQRFGRDGITGKINVEYDVERNNEDNIVQVLDGYFVHFFAPENEDPLPKHIIFVLDTSGSMKGIKIDQMKNAMVTILEELSDQDYISVISFSDDIIKMSGQQVQEFRDEASRYILQLEAEGGTNINDALVAAVEVANNLRNVVENVTPIIFFLTDGRPTIGEKNTDAIVRNIDILNHQREVDVPIFSLAFGADADFTLLREISLNNFGFAKKIYEGTDADIQLEGFYQTIATPLLKNVKFEYVGDIWEKKSLSESSTIATIFKGGENIAVGKLSPDYEGNLSQNQIIIGGEGANGRNKYNNSLQFDEITNVSPSNNINFLERLWAYMIIKRLLATEPNDPRKEATKLALKYNFVTELTSLIVTKPGEEEGSEVKSVPISSDAEVCNNCESEEGSHKMPIYAAYDYYNYEVNSDNDIRIDITLQKQRPLYDYYDPNIVDVNDTVNSKCNITIFTKTYNRGDHQTFTENQENLGSWDDKVVSLKVNGKCCWKVFTEVNYGGNSKWFFERAYNSATDLGFVFKDASSLYVEPSEIDCL